MTFARTAVLLSALIFIARIAPDADAALIPSGDGLTVYDTILHVTWLANANLPATSTFGVTRISPNGSMDFPTAISWVAALNNMNGGAGYLGHNNWTLPTSPAIDQTCGSVGPNRNSFGYGCLNSGMGALFYRSLGLQYPNTAVPIPSNTVGPFSNFQPYLYWSGTANSLSTAGYNTFSFNTGWSGANVDKHYLYVLPMIPGKLPGTPSAPGTGLQVNPGGQTIYDPVMNVTWLANADLAATQTFGAQCVNADGTPCINPDGSMSHTTAQNWINGMNAYNGGAGYVGQSNWQLPSIPNSDGGWCGHGSVGGGCTDHPMGELFFGQLLLSQGTPVVGTPAIAVGPFNHIQPYLYWSCGAPATQPACLAQAPAPNFAWSFSFGNGFQGTDLLQNNLYVMVYAPDLPIPFTDDPLTAGNTVVKGVHITELRARIDAVRVRHGLAVYVYATPTIEAGVNTIMAVDVLEMRTALGEAYTIAKMPRPTYTTSPAVGSPVHVADIADLRAALAAIE